MEWSKWMKELQPSWHLMSKMETESHLVFVTASVKPSLREKQGDTKHAKLSQLVGYGCGAPWFRSMAPSSWAGNSIAFTRPFSSGIDWAEERGLPTWKVVSSMARDMLHFLTTLWKKICFFLSVFNQTDATFHTFLLGTTPSRGNREMY